MSRQQGFWLILILLAMFLLLAYGTNMVDQVTPAKDACVRSDGVWSADAQSCRRSG